MARYDNFKTNPKNNTSEKTKSVANLEEIVTSNDKFMEKLSYGLHFIKNIHLCFVKII